MADETIVNKLGFNVTEALNALQRLDNALQNAGLAFKGFGGELDAWNSQAKLAVDQMKALASAAGRMSTAMSKTGVAPSVPTPQTAASSSGFWLPPGMEQEAKRLDAALKSAGTAGVDAGGKIKTGMDGAADATKKARDHSEKFTITWGTLSRVVMTQFIVRAMSQLRDAIRGAVEEAIEFQRRIAEIEAIAPKIGGSFASLTNEAAEFAKQFNVPLAQATEGLYQVISDQFTGMSDRANIMSAAMKLSKVGVMDFQDAVTLLTGTLNAYGMTSDQADLVAAKFFETIKLGHVRGRELAEVMGQVNPIAKELGVGLNEVSASMVALTIGGLDAHKSATALRGAMTALLKPSEDMKKVIASLGFSDPEQLVAAKGFQGALQAVSDASGGMASEIAKSVRNVRALIAELRLTTTGAKQVEEALKAMEAATPEGLDKIYKQFISTDSEKLTSAINRLKTDLVQDLGNSLVHVLAGMMDLVGGADHLSAAIQAIAAGAVPVVAGLGLLAAALGAVAIASSAAWAAMGPIGWVILGISAAVAAFAGTSTYLTANAINNTRRLAEEQHQATLKYLKDKEEELRVLRETEEKKMAEENKSWENRAATIRKDYFAALDTLRVKNKGIIESDRQVMQAMIGSQEKVVAAYRNAANNALKIVQESQNRRMSLEDQYSDLLFKKWADEDVKFDASQKARLLLQRSWQLEAQANQQLAKAQTEDEVRRAQAIQQRAKSYLDEGAVLAKETGETWLQEQAQRSIRTNLEQRIQAEKQLETMQAARAQKLADEAAKEQKRLDEMKALVKAILKDLEAFDKEGPKTPAQLAAQQTRLTENVAAFRDKFLEGRKVDVSDLLNLDQLQRRVAIALESGVSKAEIDEFYATPTAFAKLRADITKGVGPVEVMIMTGRVGGSEQMWKATEGLNAAETVQYFSKELKRTEEIVKQFNASRDALAQQNTTLARLEGDADRTLADWKAGHWVADVRALGGIWERFTDHVANTPLVKQARQEFEKAAAPFITPGAKIETGDLDKLNEAYKLYLGVLNPSETSRKGLEAFFQKAQTAADAAKKAVDIEKGLREMEPGVTEAQRNRPALENALKAAEAVRDAAEKAKASTGEMKTSSEGASKALGEVSQINMGGLVNQAELLADAMWDAANASQYVPPLGTMTAAHGGVAWKFLAGGGPAGTDVIPAMLSPGEVVINAASARRFASQLTAINAGVQPVYRSEGGSVTNIGDINVTVTGGGTSRQTARSIASELRRELRRGTAIL